MYYYYYYYYTNCTFIHVLCNTLQKKMNSLHIKKKKIKI